MLHRRNANMEKKQFKISLLLTIIWSINLINNILPFLHGTWYPSPLITTCFITRMTFWERKSFEQGQHKWAKDLTRAVTLIRLFLLNKCFIHFNWNRYIRTILYKYLHSWALFYTSTYVTGRIFPWPLTCNPAVLCSLSLSLSLSLS